MEALVPHVFACVRCFNRSMWSDTGNERYDSRGDIEHRVNLDSFNIQGPNTAQSKVSTGRKGGIALREASTASSAISSVL
jgi:hypothetical protein